MTQRIILHLDMDCFFAAIEIRDHPEWKGKPVIIGADPEHGRGRGVVSTCSMEARKLGIRSAMPISKAYQLCPQGVFYQPCFDKYTRVSGRIMEIVKHFCPVMEQASIDEAYTDACFCGEFESARLLAQRIQQEIHEKEHLTCSIGIAPNKLLAKIASDYHKPNGLTMITYSQVSSFLHPLELRKLPGIGEKTEQLLQNIGIFTIGELASISTENLRNVVGLAAAHYLSEAAQGIDNRPLVDEYLARSVGRERTFHQDTKIITLLQYTLAQLARQVIIDLRSEGFMRFKKVMLRLRYEDFETHTKQYSLIAASDSHNVLFHVAWYLMNPFLRDKRRIRLLGIRVGSLQ
ncbi:DNA polymerase IV [Candidatus Woesearchaeota archaeon]|nr:DNA polymerase IV [Candidatus Woesearchaeota archaeon]